MQVRCMTNGYKLLDMSVFTEPILAILVVIFMRNCDYHKLKASWKALFTKI